MIAISLSAIALLAGGKYVYDYGSPVGYEAYAITTGEKIPLPKEWVHIHWTESYLIANGFHTLVNTMPSVLMSSLAILGAGYGVYEGVAALIVIVTLLFNYFRKRDPSNFPNNGPYKAW